MIPPLDIAPTKNTPMVKYFDTVPALEINGESYPENAIEFYRPVIAWMRQNVPKLKGEFCLNLKLNYFNTSSSKCLLDLLTAMEDLGKSGHAVRIVWFYEKEDEDMMESGQEFADGIEVPFELRAF